MGEVPVGCVFVYNPSGEIIGRGRNRTNESLNVKTELPQILIMRLTLAWILNQVLFDAYREHATQSLKELT